MAGTSCSNQGQINDDGEVDDENTRADSYHASEDNDSDDKSNLNVCHVACLPHIDNCGLSC